MPKEVDTGEVTLKVTNDPAPKEKDQTDKDSVTDADDLVEESGDDKDTGDTEKGKIKVSEKSDEEEKSDKTPDDKGEKKVDPKLSEFEQRLARLEKDKRDLQIALHKERQAKKAAPKKEEDAELSDEQLEQILRENPGDEKVWLRVQNYIAQRAAKRQKVEAIQEVNTSAIKQKLDGLILSRYPDLTIEGSEMRNEVEQVKSALGLSNHPYGDFFAVGTRVLETLPQIIKDAYEKGRADGISGKADERRKDKIKGDELTPSGGKKKSGGDAELSKDQSEAAKQMNLTASQKRIYKSLVGKSPRTVSVED